MLPRQGGRLHGRASRRLPASTAAAKHWSPTLRPKWGRPLASQAGASRLSAAKKNWAKRSPRNWATAAREAHSANIVSQNMGEINGNLCTERISFYNDFLYWCRYLFSFTLLQKVFFKHALNFFNLFSQLQHFFINLCNVNCTFL